MAEAGNGQDAAAAAPSAAASAAAATGDTDSRLVVVFRSIRNPTEPMVFENTTMVGTQN